MRGRPIRVRYGRACQRRAGTLWLTILQSARSRQADTSRGRKSTVTVSSRVGYRRAAVSREQIGSTVPEVSSCLAKSALARECREILSHRVSGPRPAKHCRSRHSLPRGSVVSKRANIGAGTRPNTPPERTRVVASIATAALGPATWHLAKQTGVLVRAGVSKHGN
jgi:hypothetical protein